jgi:SAM-dependent methyltransferase
MLHEQACELVPDCLLARVSDEFIGEAVRTVQAHRQIPGFLSEQLCRMGATYNPQRQEARFNYDADDARNRIYLGTYFPKTVIESWNIFTELFSIPVIQAAFRQKDVIRIMDVGAGTGAAVVGILLALMEWEEHNISVEVISLDTNEDALAKQREILEFLRNHLTFKLEFELRNIRLPFDLDGFVPAFSGLADQEGRIYDIITIWKCLCEFYNVNFASAQGIIRNTLSTASRMLLPYGLCVVSDVTTTDNQYEYFAITLNREANEHDREPYTETCTVLPLPCGRNSAECIERHCYSQRLFRLNHRLAQNDVTKIAYRVLATNSFAHSIITSFTDNDAYRINAARPSEACCNGRKGVVEDELPCGYTGFFS